MPCVTWSLLPKTVSMKNTSESNLETYHAPDEDLIFGSALKHSSWNFMRDWNWVRRSSTYLQEHASHDDITRLTFDWLELIHVHVHVICKDIKKYFNRSL